ncbi:MAG: energy-coupling factor transporter transmembrane component T [Christensenellaceae bacterium]
MKDTFSTYHPSIQFIYFAFVILVTMFLWHPVLLAISFGTGMIYSIYLNGKKAVKFHLLGLLPLMVVAALINPLFNHEGVNILLYVNGNPITLESIWFGVAAAVMLGAVILWFSCYNTIMTSDKFVYLFGRAIPALSLILSMVLRFVPKYQAQMKRICGAQKCIGKNIGSGNWIIRAKNGMMILSVMTTWAFENAIETADSMKSRGYGLSGRTAYSIYRFDARDKALLIGMVCLLVLILCSMGFGVVSVRYFPSFRLNDIAVQSGIVYVAYAAVCLLPMILDIKEDIVWRSLRSQI